MENFWIGFLVAMVIILLIVLVIGGVSICKLFKRVKRLEYEVDINIPRRFDESERHEEEKHTDIYQTIDHTDNEFKNNLALNIHECIKTVTALVDSRFDRLEFKYKK